MNHGYIFRELKRSEIDLIWEIDRSQVVEKVYYHRGGELVLETEHYNIPGWPPDQPAADTPWLLDCFDHGGCFIAAFHDGSIAGVSVLERRFIGRHHDQLQLVFLHVGRPYRGTGLGRRLFEMCAGRARELGAASLYISSNPSEATVDFYHHLGCIVTADLNRELFQREPYDIHMEYQL